MVYLKLFSFSLLITDFIKLTNYKKIKKKKIKEIFYSSFVMNCEQLVAI